MKISRYIKFPLIFAVIMYFNLYLFFESKLDRVITAFALGAIIGIGLQIYSDYKTRKIKPDAEEKDFAPQQNQTISLLCNFDEAFGLCMESVTFLKKGKVKLADKENGYIKAKTAINWNSFGNTIEFRLKPITENTTEIEIYTQPNIGTTLIDYGESVETIETIKKFFAAKNEDLSYKLLESKFDIPINIESNQFKKTNSYSR